MATSSTASTADPPALTACPGCGAAALQPAGWPGAERAVCGRCGRCWSLDPLGAEVDVQGCPGCDQRALCESCPTALVAEESSEHVLADGTRVLVRPLLHSDRFALAAGFRALSERSRHLRFFNPPEKLEGAELEYLTNIDYRRHCAVAAFAVDEPGAPGIGVARYVRAEGTTTAEVAVTVLDEYQQRGLGTLLTRVLADWAIRNGVRSFVNYVRWDNDKMLDLLRAEGATITPAEPGIARVELALPGDASEVPEPALHRVLHLFADLFRQLVDWPDADADADAP